jgi:hypothetical protein
MRVVLQQAATVRATAKLFSVPYRHLRNAVQRAELSTFGTGDGRAAVLLFEDVRAFLRAHPTKQREKLS